MGFIKKMQMEKDEEEYNQHIREVQEALDEMGEDMDAEDWEAMQWSLDKDD